MLSEVFVSRYRGQQPAWGFDGLGYVTYKRSYAQRVEGESRTEEWWETIQRVVNGALDIEPELTTVETERLYDHMFNLRGTVGGRMLWQLGTPNVQRLGGDSLVNCWWTDLHSPEDFCFLMTELMLGGGVGFSVRQLDVGRLPYVSGGPAQRATHVSAPDADFIVPDKREGWVDLLRRVLTAYFTLGQTFTYSTQLVRGAGEPIKTFGGTASGPGILVEGMDKIQQVLASRAGGRLRSVDALDIANIIGSVVVAGNVRRSAEIAVGDPGDLPYLRAKRRDTGAIPTWRGMSNNSVEVSRLDDLPTEFWAGYLGNGEPYGIVNLAAGRRFGRTGEERPDYSVSGVNPCAEILLGHHEPCNLAEIFLPRISSLTELQDLASLLYKVQKAVAALPYTDPTTHAIVRKNRRLGLSVSGVAQATEEQLSWLRPTYDYLRALDREWSAERGWPESVRLTTVKPSGTLSLLAGVTPGVHPGFSQFHVRRVRMASDDSLVAYCRDLGYPTEFERFSDGTDNYRTTVVSFPASFPAGTWTTDDDDDPFRQLELALRMQRDWADNSVSVSVYYDKDNLPGIRAWLAEHWGEFKTISFFLRDGHGFDQPPLQEVSEEEYNELRAGLRPVTAMYEDTFTLLGELDELCDSGACPIR